MATDNAKGADRFWVRGQGEEEGKNLNEARLHLDFEWMAYNSKPMPDDTCEVEGFHAL